jgi:sugar phosphate permease
MTRLRNLHYAWIVAGVTVLALMIGAGVRSAPGILIVPLQQEFGWSRGTISFAIGLNIFLYGLVGPFAAAVIEKGGLRRTLLAALVLIAVGTLATLWMRAAWQLILLWGVVVGIGCGIPATLFGVIVAERWFARRRGLVLGALTASGAAGPLLFLPPMAAIVSAWGWREMSLCLVAAIVLLIPVVALLMRDRPQDLGLAPYGDVARVATGARLVGNPVAFALRALAEASRSRDFWLLAATFFICGLSTNGLIATHLVPACVDHGISEVTGASLLAAMGMLNFIGVTASGWLSDRYDARILLACYYAVRAPALMFLPFAFGLSFYGLSLFSLLYGLDWFATVPPTVRLTAEAFGRDRAAIMFGWVTVSHQLGGAVAAYLGGVLRDRLGTYLEAFLIAGLLCFAAALMALMIGTGRRRDAPADAPLAVG